MWRPVTISIAVTTSFLALMLWQVDMNATADPWPKAKYTVASNSYFGIKRLVLTFSANPVGLLLEGPQ